MRICTVVVVFSLLQACTAVPAAAPEQAVIAPDLSIAVPGPDTLGQNVVVTQAVTAHFRDQSYVLQADISLTAGSLEFAALDGLGRRLFSVHWHDGAFDYQPTPAIPSQLRPANMLADMAIIYWPAESLRPALSRAGADLIATAGSRSITFGGREVIHVDYENGNGWTGRAHYRNLAFGYTLDIQSAEISQ